MIKNKNNEEKDDLIEEQKIICSFRNIIKNSFCKELNFKNIDIQGIMKKIDEINTIENTNKIISQGEKIMEFFNDINITSSFDIFIKDLHIYNPFNKNHKTNL